VHEDHVVARQRRQRVLGLAAVVRLDVAGGAGHVTRSRPSSTPMPLTRSTAEITAPEA
jgi:hypothetical protein